MGRVRPFQVGIQEASKWANDLAANKRWQTEIHGKPTAQPTVAFERKEHGTLKSKELDFKMNLQTPIEHCVVRLMCGHGEAFPRISLRTVSRRPVTLIEKLFEYRHGVRPHHDSRWVQSELGI
jgi:hypothetical protein